MSINAIAIAGVFACHGIFMLLVYSITFRANSPGKLFAIYLVMFPAVIMVGDWFLHQVASEASMLWIRRSYLLVFIYIFIAVAIKVAVKGRRADGG